MSQNSLFGKTLPEKYENALNELRVGYESVDITDIKASILNHLSSLEAALHYNEFIDIGTAQKLEEVLTFLLDNFHQFDEREQSYIIGAARYFIREQDEKPDTQSILGLDDDVKIVNHVLDMIGRSDLKVVL